MRKMFLSFRLAIAFFAFITVAKAADDEKPPTPAEQAELQRMMKMMMDSMSRISGGNLDENTVYVAKQLAVLPLEKLYFLKMSDTCEVAGFSCGKFNAEKVRPLIDIELDRRKA